MIEETYEASPSPTTTIAQANGYADGWRERFGGSVFFVAYVFDPQGSLQAEDVSSNVDYPAENVYVYDGYGNRLVGERIGDSGSFTQFNQDPVRFGGQLGYYTDLSTGEVDLTHWYYDAGTGHFLNRDPIK